MTKFYLGDGVYIEFVEAHQQLILTTERDGDFNNEQRIIFEYETYRNLELFVRNLEQDLK